MSLQSPTAGGPSHQPYQCLICQTRFTRLENLKRHAALHSRSQDEVSFPCDHCQVTFSRRDLRHRHTKRKHPEHELDPTAKRVRHDSRIAATWREKAKSKADRPAECDYSVSPTQSDGEGTPGAEGEDWSNDVTHDDGHHDVTLARDTCTYSAGNMLATGFAASSSSPSVIPHPTNGLSPRDMPYVLEDWFPTPSQIARGVHLYFTHVAHYVPFLHRATFDVSQTAPHLVLGMLCLAYQHDDYPEGGETADPGADLSLRCYHRARVLASTVEARNDDSAHNVTLVQTYLLLEVCAMMYLCGDYSSSGLKMHSEMVSLARFGGLTQRVPTMAAETADLEALWREFANNESRKRTMLAAHQIDALWYQLLSIPRSLSHLELKHHDLPCPEDSWMASSSTQWAHGQLLRRYATDSIRYADAIQRLLLSQPDTDMFPAFDPYGAINIAQFLISSAREVSGWSTMTGRLSLERSALLKSSLVALEPLSRTRTETAKIACAATCEVTWEMAMIELDMWSLSHTCGIVEGSVNGVLTQSTCVASSSEFLIETDVAHAIQPRIDWFLRYLDASHSADCEAPWVTLYCYKVFLIAWQLLRRGSQGAMKVVGVGDGDISKAMTWARDVFQRRRRRQPGKLILSCLDLLDMD